MEDAAWASYETAQQCDDAGDAEGAARAYEACAAAWRVLWLRESADENDPEGTVEAGPRRESLLRTQRARRRAPAAREEHAHYDEEDGHSFQVLLGKVRLCKR